MVPLLCRRSRSRKATHEQWLDAAERLRIEVCPFIDLDCPWHQYKWSPFWMGSCFCKLLIDSVSLVWSIVDPTERSKEPSYRSCLSLSGLSVLGGDYQSDGRRRWRILPFYLVALWEKHWLGSKNKAPFSLVVPGFPMLPGMWGLCFSSSHALENTECCVLCGIISAPWETKVAGYSPWNIISVTLDTMAFL
jgi:hypothetical protein